MKKERCQIFWLISRYLSLSLLVSLCCCVSESEEDQRTCPLCWFVFADLLLKWNCCGYWRWLKQRLYTFITNPFFDLGIVVCLVLNTVFMAAEHYPMTEGFYWQLTVAHLVSVKENNNNNSFSWHLQLVRVKVWSFKQEAASKQQAVNVVDRYVTELQRLSRWTLTSDLWPLSGLHSDLPSWDDPQTCGPGPVRIFPGQTSCLLPRYSDHDVVPLFTRVSVLLPWLQVGWNVFDSIVVAVSLQELFLFSYLLNTLLLVSDIVIATNITK